MEDLGFGEDKELIDYILKGLSKENKEGINEECISIVLDIILDYYESIGLLEEDDNDESVEIDEEEMFQYIAENAQKEGLKITDDQLNEILDLEYEFNQKNGVFD